MLSPSATSRELKGGGNVEVVSRSVHRRKSLVWLVLGGIFPLLAISLFGCQSAASVQALPATGSTQPEVPTGQTTSTREAVSPRVLAAGGLFELTGNGAGLGVPQADGVKAAIAEINAAGGIKLGNDAYSIDLKLYDTRGIVADAVGLTEKLVNEDQVRVIFGPAYSSSAKATAPISQKAKVIQVSATAEFQGLMGKPGYEYAFMGTMPPGGKRGTVDLYTNWVVDRTKIKSVALLLPNDDAGKTYTGFFTDKFNELSVKIVSKDQFEHGNQDFYPVLTKIKSMNPDAIVFGFSDDDAMPIVRQAVEIGYDGYFIGSPGISGVPGLKAADKPINHYVWRALKDMSSQDPKTQKFIKTLKNDLGKDVTSSTEYSVPFYTWTHFLADTIQKVGTLDWEKINRALHEARYSGLLNIEVDKTGQTRHDFAAGTIEDGKVKYYPILLPAQ